VVAYGNHKSMGFIHHRPPEFMVEHRQDQRAQRDLAVQVSGRDAKGNAFSQGVNASNISKGGALLSGLSSGVRSGDLVWVEYQGRKARFRIVWVRDSHAGLSLRLPSTGWRRKSVRGRYRALFLDSGTIPASFAES
jgi:hypothetical protein